MSLRKAVSYLLYEFVASVRVLMRTFTTLLATTYYQLTCAEFGSKSVVRWGTWIRYPGNVHIGNNVFIAENVSIGSEIKNSALCISSSVQINYGVAIDYTGGMTIGENTLISEQSMLYSHSHGLNPRSKPTRIEKYIGSNCWIGSRCTILERCSQIADGSVIGSGSIVTKSIENDGLYAGVPARLIRTLLHNNKEEKLPNDSC